MAIAIVVLFRAFLAFFLLLILARLMGKTQVSQLSFFDYITGITIGSIAASMSIDTSIQTISAAVGLVVWAGLAIGMEFLVLKSIPARKLIQGEPTIVIQNGKLMEDAMRKANYNTDQLMVELRGQKVFDLSTVQEAILETDGKLSVLTKPEDTTVTRKDLNVSTAQMGRQPIVLIVDGNIAHHRLGSLGLNEDWLKQQLKTKGIDDPHNVMVCQLGTTGEMYVDLREDWEVKHDGMV